ncbi:polyprenyl synthetase family protein [Fructobacillus sp. M1-13]|uniref:Polyprenyl synthetase family protein n=1 Tax=Fructobacillus papyriferae TaxID=2713171 RepID=A0ABS5QPU4_9LACO|nr:polyprenyl synthetase family protein [Fructobacillus papyriferae]MBS9334927.1 polyprenyl synthetase family protein [Fructobacillus papyriferae]MCD2159589.1 polyprenyl synthetase family protein [Fructobacillus papyriferae]
MTKFQDFIKSYKPAVDEALVQESSRPDLTKISSYEKDDDYVSALQYALLTPGKRLRPLLALAVLDSFGKKIDEDAVTAASAIEWVHAYSLVHDDLPEMDNDAYRRGKLSVHAMYGPALAVLVGDALQGHAYQILSSLKKVSAEQKVQMVSTLSGRSGAFGMVYGQVLDMQNHNVGSRVEQFSILNKVYQMKTADLLVAAALIGSQYAGLDQEAQTMVERYAQNLGLLFQIQDDVDDYEQDEEEGVLSLVHFYGLDESKQLAMNLREQAKKALAELAAYDAAFDSALLTDLIDLIGA